MAPRRPGVRPLRAGGERQGAIDRAVGATAKWFAALAEVSVII
jgi:hypothetical protein